MEQVQELLRIKDEKEMSKVIPANIFPLLQLIGNIVKHIKKNMFESIFFYIL